MNINDLPEEILVRILSFLSRSDRLESALTCRQWSRAIAAPSLLRDTWLAIEEFRKDEAEIVFANSHRLYENLRISRAPLLNYKAAFWTNIGKNLRNLEIIECDCSPEVFYGILQACCNLESLKICRRYKRVTMFRLAELPPGINLTTIQKSMRNLRQLHLKFLMNADMLEHLLILMPNVSSIDLGLFDEKSDFVSRLPKILGTSHKITTLDLNWKFSGDEGEQLLGISSISLRKLQCREGVFTWKAFDAFLNCTMLRDLDIQVAHSIDHRLLYKILGNVPELESLSIRMSSYEIRYKPANLMPIFNLRKLRILQLDLGLEIGSDSCIPDEIMRELRRMSSLETLTLGKELGAVDSTRLRILARLPKLRSLEIHHFDWDPEGLAIILFDLRKLRTLTIHGDPSGARTHETRVQHPELEQESEAAVLVVSSERLGQLESSSLEVLKLKYLRLSDDCLGHIAAHHTGLKVVYINECPYITDVGLTTLIHHEPFLENLRVFSENNIDGTFLEPLGKKSRRLRSLRVYTSAKISSQAEEAFKLRKPRVKYVNGKLLS